MIYNFESTQILCLLSGWTNFQLLIGVRKDEPVVTQDIVKGKNSYNFFSIFSYRGTTVFDFQRYIRYQIEHIE